jgi:hypothetical protein
MEEYVKTRASAQPENARRLTPVRVSRNSDAYVCRGPATRRHQQPRPHDIGYINLNNTETPPPSV